MNLRDLDYLVAVADHGSFVRAAAACHVSQPTLSMQLKKLEQHLGVILIERGAKGSRDFFFTPVGERILERARLILREAGAIRTLAALEKDPEGGVLRLGIIPTVAPYWLPWMLPRLREHFPRLEVLLTEDRTAHLVEQLAKGDLDVLFLALPLADPGTESHEVTRESFWLAAPRDHPLARRKSVRTDDLEGQKVLLLEEGHCFRDQALDVCHRAGAVEDARFRATSLETIRQMVAAGGGITLIPDRARSLQPGLTFVRFQSPEPSRSLGLAWRQTFPRRELLLKMGKMLSKWVKTRPDAPGL